MKIKRLLIRAALVSLTLGVLAELPGVSLAGAGRAPVTANLTPLAEFLSPDGTLDLSTGFSGALDPAGYRMDYAADGAPVFAKALGTDAPRSPANAWNALGSGLNGSVRAIAVSGSNVYVGGEYSDADADEADYIARWGGILYPVYLPLVPRSY